MARNIQISGDEDELDAEEDEREPVNGDVVSDNEGLKIYNKPLKRPLLDLEKLPILDSSGEMPPRLMDPKKTRQYMGMVQVRGKTRQNERLQVVKHEGDGGDDFDDPDLPKFVCDLCFRNKSMFKELCWNHKCVNFPWEEIQTSILRYLVYVQLQEN
ncbi:uncharacterized protein LOC131299138 [Rhododendron vialii]|uniref:uncharacterized protein LOC131299138 n=1 Tax=Rhododendron vialii TaxID=182163 RepID=UPI00265ED060|nr:uncharacterized protein LOC131299138 [Rhododendron vialii]